MNVRIRDYRRVRAVSSVMEFWPAGNYVEFMPKGTVEQRLGKCWLQTGQRLTKSMKRYEVAHNG